MNESMTASFSTLILSLSTSALANLGYEIEAGKQPEKNLDIAQFNIDMLVILKEKTQNNLSDDESNLLSHMINDLQLKFIEAKK